MGTAVDSGGTICSMLMLYLCTASWMEAAQLCVKFCAAAAALYLTVLAVAPGHC